MDYRPVQFLMSGNPSAAAGTAYFYEVGTLTGKTMYDEDSVSIGTSIVLDAYGSAGVYGTGLVRIIIKDSDGTTIADYDNLDIDFGGWPSGHFYDIAVTHGARNSTALAAAIAAVGSNEVILYFDDGAWSITENATINAASIADYHPDAVLTVSAGKTLAHGSSDTERIPAKQHFAGSGTVTFPAGSIVKPQWWGADGSSDDSAAIQSAVDSLTAGGKCILDGVDFVTSSKVTVDTLTVDFIQYRKITFSGSGIALEIGASSGNSLNRNHRLWVERSSQADWTDESDTGIKIINLNTSFVEIVKIDKFTIGLQLEADTYVLGFNKFEFGHISNNKYGIDITQLNSGAPNENTFINPRISVGSGVLTTLDRYGVRFSSQDDTYLTANNNVFIKPSFELSHTGAITAVPVLMECGQENTFISARHDGNTSNFAILESAVQLNRFDIGKLGSPATATVDEQGTAPTSIITYNGQQITGTDGIHKIFQSLPLHKTWCYYDGATNINLPGIAIGNSSDATDAIYTSGLTTNASYMEIPSTRIVGIYIDTSTIKKFRIYSDTVSSFGGRVLVRAYDASGTVLDNLGANHPYVQGTVGVGFAYNASYGKVYLTGADSNLSTFFWVHDDVKYIYVGRAGGTAALRIRSFTVASTEGTNTSWWTGHENVGFPGYNRGTAAPTAGTWIAGHIVIDDTPSAGGKIGWVCTTGGTPGTWKTFGSITA